VQYPCGIANAARIHRHIDDLLFDLRGETGVGICQEKRPSTPSTARTAPIALLAFRRRAMSHNIRVLAIDLLYASPLHHVTSCCINRFQPAFPFRQAKVRRRKDDTGVGTAARRIVE
jgi:hypothetical protein